MAEHTPAPTPDRAVYGFALYILFHTLFIIYVIWAFVPSSILVDQLGLTYLPDKYFALYIPFLFLCGVAVFAFFIYPSLSLIMTPEIEDPITIRDQFTVYRCQHDDNGNKCDNKVDVDFSKGWEVGKFCNMHKTPKDLNQFDETNNDITNFCDCPEGRTCVIRENPNHVKELKGRTKIPAVCDLDLADVCREIFSNSR